MPWLLIHLKNIVDDIFIENLLNNTVDFHFKT